MKKSLIIKNHKKVISLDKYAGHWVAFAHGKIIAHQNTLGKLMKKVEKVKTKPSVFLVPGKSEGPYI